MKKCFEGWYFKNATKNHTIAFIPGIAISKKQKTAFIQVISDNESYYIPYDYGDFKHCKKPFYVQIGNSYFSNEKIILDIKDKNLNLTGELLYKDNVKLKSSLYEPTIMGPFSYIPKMQCKHGVLSLYHKINGHLIINNKKINFKDGIGYIEKDWGSSFPEKYFWEQGNNFKNDTVSLMVAVAKIPFGLINFIGLLSVLYINGKEYRFTTYNNSKIKLLKKEKNKYFVILKNNKYLLEVIIVAKEGKNLKSPINGQMDTTIKETLGCQIELKLTDKASNLIYNGLSSNGGFEWQL